MDKRTGWLIYFEYKETGTYRDTAATRQGVKVLVRIFQAGTGLMDAPAFFQTSCIAPFDYTVNPATNNDNGLVEGLALCGNVATPI